MYANQTKMNLLNLYLSTVIWEKVTFDIYLPCTVINLKTWENTFLTKTICNFYKEN